MAPTADPTVRAVIGQRIWSDGERTWLSSRYDIPDIREPGRKSIATHPGLLYYASCTGKAFHRSLLDGLRFEGRVLGDQAWTIRALLRAGAGIEVVADTVFEWSRPRPGAAVETITTRARGTALGSAGMAGHGADGLRGGVLGGRRPDRRRTDPRDRSSVPTSIGCCCPISVARCATRLSAATRRRVGCSMPWPTSSRPSRGRSWRPRRTCRRSSCGRPRRTGRRSTRRPAEATGRWSVGPLRADPADDAPHRVAPSGRAGVRLRPARAADRPDGRVVHPVGRGGREADRPPAQGTLTAGLVAPAAAVPYEGSQSQETDHRRPRDVRRPPGARDRRLRHDRRPARRAPPGAGPGRRPGLRP